MIVVVSSQLFETARKLVERILKAHWALGLPISNKNASRVRFT